MKLHQDIIWNIMITTKSLYKKTNQLRFVFNYSNFKLFSIFSSAFSWSSTRSKIRIIHFIVSLIIIFSKIMIFYHIASNFLFYNIPICTINSFFLSSFSDWKISANSSIVLAFLFSKEKKLILQASSSFPLEATFS